MQKEKKRWKDLQNYLRLCSIIIICVMAVGCGSPRTARLNIPKYVIEVEKEVAQIQGEEIKLPNVVVFKPASSIELEYLNNAEAQIARLKDVEGLSVRETTLLSLCGILVEQVRVASTIVNTSNADIEDANTVIGRMRNAMISFKVQIEKMETLEEGRKREIKLLKEQLNMLIELYNKSEGNARNLWRDAIVSGVTVLGSIVVLAVGKR